MFHKNLVQQMKKFSLNVSEPYYIYYSTRLSQHTMYCVLQENKNQPLRSDVKKHYLFLSYVINVSSAL